VTPIDLNQIVTPALDHVITVLATMLNGPVRRRDEFLHSSITDNEQEDSVGKWTVIDSCGESDEESTAGSADFMETDLIAFLSQIPFSDVIRQLLGISGNDSVRVCSDEQNFLTILSVCSRICLIFKSGLDTYKHLKYKQFGKLVCRMLTHCALFVTEHWKVICAKTPERNPALQAEYDAFIERIFLIIRGARKFGSWQFLSELSYAMLSLDKLLDLKTIALCVKFPVPLPEDADSEDENVVTGLNDLVGVLSESDSFYIMAAIIKMATSRPASCGGDRQFLTSVVLDILKVSLLMIDFSL
jgi:hypothetical protein